MHLSNGHKNGTVPRQICLSYPKICALELQDSSGLTNKILRCNHVIADVLWVWIAHNSVATSSKQRPQTMRRLTLSWALWKSTVSTRGWTQPSAKAEVPTSVHSVNVRLLPRLTHLVGSHDSLTVISLFSGQALANLIKLGTRKRRISGTNLAPMGLNASGASAVTLGACHS